MSLLDRIRSMFTSDPTEGHPAPGAVMDRGGGEEQGWHDDVHDRATGREFGAPNDTLDETVRPPLE